MRMILRVRGRREGRSEEMTVESSVIPATNPEVLAAHARTPLEGISLLPVLTGEKNSVARPAPLFWHWSGCRGVREGDTKLVWEKSTKEWELYDLSKDRTETNNLAAKMPDKVKQLDALIDRFIADTGALAPKPNPACNPAAAKEQTATLFIGMAFAEALGIFGLVVAMLLLFAV